MDPKTKAAIKAAHENLSLAPQCKLILEYLRAGRTLTQLIAITQLGIGSLTKRISQLRERGYEIESERKLDFKGRVYMAYWLHEEK